MTLQLASYLGLAWATGVALTFISGVQWRLEGRLAIGVPLGFGAATFITWVAAVPLGMSGGPVVVGVVGLLLVLGACARWTRWRSVLRLEARSLVERWRSGAELPLAIALLLALAFFVPFYARALVLRPDGLYASYVTIWGDWATHLTLSGYLSGARHLLPPQSPWFAGTNITYSFLPDFFSAIHTHLGVTTAQSLPLTSAVMSIAFIVVFYGVALRFTRSRWAALIAVLLFFLSGGTGLLRVFGDAAAAGRGHGGLLGGVFDVLAHPPRQYTQDIPTNYQWLNPVLAYLVPQRTTLFGWPLGMLTLVLLWHGWTQRARREMLLAGLLLGLLPLFHIGTYADMLIIGGGFALLTVPGALRRHEWWSIVGLWCYFFIPAVAVGAPQILTVVPHAPYAVPFLRWQLGWLADAGNWRNDSIPTLVARTAGFWFQNTGFLLLLALAGLYLVYRRRTGLALMLAPTLLLFILPNLAAMAPWDWDNTKYLTWWAMPAAMLAALALVRLGRLGALGAVVAAALLVFQVGAGALDLNRAWEPQVACGSVCAGPDAASHTALTANELRFLDSDELALAGWVRANTGRDAVFLTGQQHNHPIVTMSQRVEMLGFLGDLYSWGVAYYPRYLEVISIYRGDPNGASLLARYNVSYIVIGPVERHDLGADPTRLSPLYPLVYSSPGGEYQIFSVPRA